MFAEDNISQHQACRSIQVLQLKGQALRSIQEKFVKPQLGMVAHVDAQVQACEAPVQDLDRQ